jgi:toxin ParE1/3/4
VSKKPVRLRELAHRDTEAAVDYYIREAGPEVALAFVEALRIAYRMIADHPTAGSPRPTHELARPGLRSRMLKRYPISSSMLSRMITSMSGAYCMPIETSLPG